MNENICQNCIYFRQHYVLDSQSAMKAECGHCVFPRIKRRRPGQVACAHFTGRTEEPKLPDRKGIVHFLTTELMQYILGFDLPPEIK